MKYRFIDYVDQHELDENDCKGKIFLGKKMN